MKLPKDVYEVMAIKAKESQCVQQVEFDHEGKTYQASVNAIGEVLETEVVAPKAE